MGDRHSVKLTVTYSDGSTEDFDTFIAVVAAGLIPAGREGNNILYTAGENLSCNGMARIAATPEVAVALVKALLRIVFNMIDSMPPEIATSAINAMLSMRTEETELYKECRSVPRKQG